MSLDGFLTFLGLLVAAYAIIPRERRINFTFKFNIIDWLIIVFGILSIHYLQFYQLFKSIGLAVNTGLSKYGLAPNNVTYLVVIMVFIFLWIHHVFASLPRKQIYKFRDLAELLLEKNLHEELFYLLDKHLVTLDKIYNSNYFFPNIRKKIEADFQEYLSRIRLEEIIDSTGKINSKFHFPLSYRIRNRLSKIFPAYQKEADAAFYFVNQVLLSPGLINSLVHARPYLIIKICECKFREKSDLLAAYLSASLEYPSSIIFREIKNNNNMTNRFFYDLPFINKLLYFLFNDVSNANTLAAWKGPGEFVIQKLDLLLRDKPNDPYNRTLDNYHDIGKYRCPIYVTIRFFDIMVLSALKQGITWHMWLYYFYFFTRGIVRNYKPFDELYDRNDEWPIKYSYLLYEIISCLRSWILAADGIPQNQENIILDTFEADHENNNIPKSSIICLGQCLGLIVKSPSIEDEFKYYILEIVFKIYLELQVSNNLKKYSEVLRKAMVHEGSYESRVDREYVERLALAFKHFDRIPYPPAHCQELDAFFKTFI